MDTVVQQLTDLIDRMYQEGNALQQRCNEQEVAMKVEREQAKAWLERTQKDLQQQSEEWALDRKAEFEKILKQEQAELLARTQKEQEAMRQQSQNLDQRHAEAANWKLESARKDMVEQFQHQKRDLQDELINQNRSKMEEYRRDCGIYTQLALDTNREKIKMDVESQLTQKAKAYQKSAAEELERERASVTVLRKDRDAM